MSEKSEALRLADLLEMGSLWPDQEEAARKLRRQHAEIESLRREQEEDQCAIRVWRRRADQAEAQRDALLEALKSVLCRFDPQAVPGYEINIAAVEQAEAAIKAVEEDSK